jgi:hypothetical protein
MLIMGTQVSNELSAMRTTNLLILILLTLQCTILSLDHNTHSSGIENLSAQPERDTEIIQCLHQPYKIKCDKFQSLRTSFV